MIKNYIKVALRSLVNQKFYSILNISGLSVGLTCFILISLFIKYEASYDTHFKDAENIYRFDFRGDLNGRSLNTALACPPAAKTMVKDFPEVTDGTRLRGMYSYLINRVGNTNVFKQEKVIFADPNVFTFFDLPLKYGDPTNALDKPKSIALDATTAETIFGSMNPVGEMVVLDSDKQYEVSAVFEDLPENIHFQTNMMISLLDQEDAQRDFWLSINYATYLKLKPEADPATLSDKLPAFTTKYMGQVLKDFLGVEIGDLDGIDDPVALTLFPLLDIHLRSDKLGDFSANGDITYVYIFSAIALFILLLACINFMNLATARSTKRAKEVGIRKVMGAYKSHLVSQFMAEALIISFVSAIFAVVLSATLLPYFNEVASINISENEFLNPLFLIALIGIIALVGLLAGSYPSFYLSNFNPTDTLKGKLQLGLKSGNIRSSLVVFQFFVSISMIIGTSVVYDQLSFIQNKKLGFDKDHVIMVKDGWLLEDKATIFKDELIKETSILNGTVASFLPVNTSSNNNLFYSSPDRESAQSFLMNNNAIDYDYIETLNMEIKEGRNFSKKFPTDTAAVILNESAVTSLGFETPIGKTIYSIGQDEILVPYKIIGIVENFHFSSMKENIGPLLFTLGERDGYISFRIASDDIPATINIIREKWNEFGPGKPFDFDFMDERFSRMYKSEQQIGKICGIFAFLAIFIACLGLYGLAAFTTEQKNKEIGIRKVLGASIGSIITLVSKEFIKLIAISFIIASILTFFMMDWWLQDFVYRTDLNPITFIMGGAIAILIAWVTMGLQSYKAAKANPVNSLKSE